MKTVIKVEGIKCEGCENNIKSTLIKLEGIKSVLPNHLKGEVVIEHESLDVESLEKKIAGLGYVVKQR